MARSIVNELVSHVASKPQRVENVFIGQAFTVVRLASGEVGLALTPMRHFDSCIGASRLAGSFTSYNSSELARFLHSGHSFLRAIGLATINAVLQGELKKRSDFLEGDFLDFLKIELDDKVAMIDYYTTKIGSLKTANLTIFDDRFAGKRKDIAMLPLSRLSEKLREADIVMLPPSFINKIDEIRNFASKAREFVVVHPSTPPLPEPFFKHGVTMLASMMILNPKMVFQQIMEGAGTTLFKKFCKKIVFVSNQERTSVLVR